MPNWKKLIVSGSDANLSSLTIDGALTASSAYLESASIGHLQTIYETASVIYSSGSTKFGDTLDDTHEITGSLLVTGSITGDLEGTASHAVSSSFTDIAATALTADSASEATHANTASISDFATELSQDATASHALTAVTASYVLNVSSTSSYALRANSSSIADEASTLSSTATASYSLLSSDARTSTSASIASTANSASVATRATTLSPLATASHALSAVTSSYALNVPVTSSFALRANSSSIADEASTLSPTATSSFADRATSASIADNIKTGLTISASSIDLTGNLNVAGTASFGLLTSTTASSFIIGDARILLNADTPAIRFSGMTVVDSGSDPYTTASFLYDGSTHDWKYEYESGGDHDAAVALFGPVMSDLTGSFYPVSESLVIGTGGHHLTSSTITVSNFTASMAGLFSGSFTGDGSGLTGISGGGGGGGVGATNAQTISTDLHVSQSENLMLIAPFEVADGTTITVENDAFLYAFSEIPAPTLVDSSSVAISSSYATSATSTTSATSASYVLLAESSSITSQAQNNNSASGSLSFWQGSQAEYDLISASADSNTVYFVV